MTTTTTRRHLLAGAAAVPLLPTGASATTLANGTDAAWHRHQEATVAVRRAGDRIDQVRDALPAEAFHRPFVTLPISKGSDVDPIAYTPEDFATWRDRDPLMNPDLFPDSAVSARSAWYDQKLEDLAERRARFDELRRPFDEAEDAHDRAVGALCEAEDQLLAAPVVTIEDVRRLLEAAVEIDKDSLETPAELVRSALAGLRGMQA